MNEIREPNDWSVDGPFARHLPTRALFPRMLDVPGTVVSGSKLPSCVGVIFDGRKSYKLLRVSYLEPIISEKKR